MSVQWPPGEFRSPLDSLGRKVQEENGFKPVVQVVQRPWKVELHTGTQRQSSTPSQQQLTPQRGNHSMSPLLHSRFARDSYATSSSKGESACSTSPVRTSLGYANDRDQLQESMHSFVPPSADAGSVIHPSSRDVAYAGADLRSFPQIEMSAYTASVPSVIVSSADVDIREPSDRSGKTLITATSHSNYSLPGRPIIPPSDEKKRRVLERNMRRMPSPLPHMSIPAQCSPLSSSSHAMPPQPSKPVNPNHLASPSVHLESSNDFNPRNNRSSRSVLTSVSTPPLRPLSPATSLYSTYSYYPYERAMSPAWREPTLTVPKIDQQHAHPDPRHSALVKEKKAQELRTPHEFLQLGIQCHEANQLEDSAMYFERSAKENGGCGVGMLMWGLTLRHGWGCPKDEKKGFNWLRRAAECAVEDLEKARTRGSINSNAVQTELVLAIYEVGQCFFQGWGVPKDQKMAVSYYQIAARLGDSDAQNDLAFCLANGKGCKKDRKEAAKWYRSAVAQGQSDIGLAWIYKEKYQ